ncbi:MAG: hypothetical protein MOGMAGMI_01602 [Candidatus Omnitrophica bacterium]|nr:hypothetical protein [Candidatus Omnitrophota bacterium]
MKLHQLERAQTVPASLERVFAFFKRPENLERLTPSGLGFRILTPRPIVMREGALIDYTIRLSGLPVRWTTLITRYEPPLRFVDEQLRGPYAYWHHTHEFREVAGGTEVSDRVVYALPLGALGGLLHRLYVRQELERIFGYRAEAIRSAFAG